VSHIFKKTAHDFRSVFLDWFFFFFNYFWFDFGVKKFLPQHMRLCCIFLFLLIIKRKLLFPHQMSLRNTMKILK